MPLKENYYLHLKRFLKKIYKIFSEFTNLFYKVSLFFNKISLNKKNKNNLETLNKNINF